MSAASDRDSSFITESLPIFIGEAQEQIEAIEQLLLQLEDAPGDRHLLDALFRCAHTVKGSAGIFGLHRVVAFTHHVESLLDRLRDGQIGFDAALGTLLLRCNDEIRALVGSAGQNDVADDSRADARESLVAQLKAVCRPAADAVATAIDTPAPSPRCWHRGPHGRYIRVQADRLDAVINLLGELVIASAGASLLARQTRQQEVTLRTKANQLGEMMLAQQTDRGDPQRHAAAAHGADRRDLLALSPRGARHRRRTRQGRGAGTQSAARPNSTSRWSSASPTR
jgi:chemotaxis protein histidine kinase CheA